jgi:hypothetical protein
MTAVEWFEKELQKNFNIEGVQPLYDDLFEQANEMEKQQIIDAYDNSYKDRYYYNPKNGKQYYNETFKNNK